LYNPWLFVCTRPQVFRGMVQCPRFARISVEAPLSFFPCYTDALRFQQVAPFKPGPGKYEPRPYSGVPRLLPVIVRIGQQQLGGVLAACFSVPFFPDRYFWWRTPRADNLSPFLNPSYRRDPDPAQAIKIPPRDRGSF